MSRYYMPEQQPSGSRSLNTDAPANGRNRSATQARYGAADPLYGQS